ncbi:unnamed protein product, partial [Prorocentrum cordatum]
MSVSSCCARSPSVPFAFRGRAALVLRGRAGDEAVAIFGAKVNEMSSYELERMLTQRPLRMQFAQQPGGRPADDDGQHAAEPTRAAARGHR